MNLEYLDAIRRSDVDRVRSLIDEDPSVVHSTFPEGAEPSPLVGCSGLHLCAQLDGVDIARLLVEGGIDLEIRNGEGRTALHDSIEYGNKRLRDLLIESGAVVDICVAAILGKIEHLRELLDEDSTLANDRSTGLSPLGWAAYGDQVVTATELLDRGARMDDGEILCAASVGHVDVGRLLVDRGTDVNELQGEIDANALHAAASLRYTADATAFVRMLLEAGADPSLKTGDGRTALDIATDGATHQASHRQEGTLDFERNYAAIIALLENA